VAFGWVAGDEVYGDNGPLHGWLEEQDIARGLAVACRHRVPAGAVLAATLITGPAHSPAHRLHWSQWRRRHQHRARTCHYRRQAAQEQAT
jgi:hypothetical protein